METLQEQKYRRLVAAGVGTVPSPEALARAKAEHAAKAAREARLSTARLGLYTKAGVR